MRADIVFVIDLALCATYVHGAIIGSAGYILPRELRWLKESNKCPIDQG